MLRYSRLKSIHSRQNPAVKRYHALARDRGEADRLLLDGASLIEEALNAGLRIREAAVSARRLEDPGTDRLIEQLQAHGVELTEVSDAVMAAMSPVRTPLGWVAIAERPPTSVDEVFRRTPPLVLALVDVQDPGNVGAVIRAAEAGGATGVVTSGATANPFGWKALRGAMGSAFRLPVAAQAEIDGLIAQAHSRGVQVLATVPSGATSHAVANLTPPTLLLFGSEGMGLAPEVVALADASVSIEMAEPVESLNVAVAAALVIFEAKRQRHK